MRPITKKRVTYSIDLELTEMLDRVAKKLGLKKSQLIEQILMEVLPSLDQSSPLTMLQHVMKKLEDELK